MDTRFEERCANCFCLTECDGEWYCDEAEDFCECVEDCPEGMELELTTYRIVGATTVNIEVEIEAKSLEEAIEIADSTCRIVEYANNTIGVETNDGYGDITENGWIEWSEEYSCEV